MLGFCFRCLPQDINIELFRKQWDPRSLREAFPIPCPNSCCWVRGEHTNTPKKLIIPHIFHVKLACISSAWVRPPDPATLTLAFVLGAGRSVCLFPDSGCVSLNRHHCLLSSKWIRSIRHSGRSFSMKWCHFRGLKLPVSVLSHWLFIHSANLWWCYHLLQMLHVVLFYVSGDNPILH